MVRDLNSHGIPTLAFRRKRLGPSISTVVRVVTLQLVFCLGPTMGNCIYGLLKMERNVYRHYRLGPHSVWRCRLRRVVGRILFLLR